MRTPIIMPTLTLIVGISLGIPWPPTLNAQLNDVRRGRQELLAENPSGALTYFQRAAESNPDFLSDLAPFDEGVWTLVGRAYYDMGKLAEAKKAFKKASSLYKRDNICRLYLGLTLARQGDRSYALREIRAGLEGMKKWLDDFVRTHLEGPYWSSNLFHREIQKTLALTKSRQTNWEEIIAQGEWLGYNFEIEIDEAQDLIHQELTEPDG